MSDGYLSQGVDYLGFLNGELRGLQGIATLANELIQNADDAEASWIAFDVCDDALVVENGALFSDCSEVEEKECPWAEDPARKHRCDWHRFRLIASGDKRRQGGTIGAFGIGFISVYQVTDSPEIFSGLRHWTVNPAEQEGRRIFQRSVQHLPRTMFRLPWARDPQSLVRKALQVQPISSGVTTETFEELMRVLPRAITFLRHIREIRLKRDGDLRKRIRRKPAPDGLEISDGGTTSVWRLIKGSFGGAANRLKAEPGVTHDRKPEVTIALPRAELELNGVLFAFLPTQQHTGLPFHFNADFFTSPDRKRIPFENTHEGRWNEAAVWGGAQALAEKLSALPAAMGHKPFWQMLGQIEQAHTTTGADSQKVFNIFWDGVKNEIGKSLTVFTSQGEWVEPKDAFILSRQQDEEEALPLLTKLGLRFVHEDLRKHYNLLTRGEVGVKVFGASDLAAALKSSGFDRPVSNSPNVEWMFEGANRNILGREIRILLSTAGEKLRLAQMAELGACAVALTSDDKNLVPPKSLFNADAATAAVFTRLRLGRHFVHPGEHETIISLVPGFTLEDGVRLLADLPPEHFRELWAEDKENITGLIQWLERRSLALTDELKDEIRGLPIWVSEDALHPLGELVVPGNFDDPIGIASVADLGVMGVESKFLLTLDAQELTINTYASKQVKRKFDSGAEIECEVRRRLLHLFAEKFGELSDDAKAQGALASCPIVECVDGIFRTPDKVYFASGGLRSLLGDDVPVAEGTSHQSIRTLLNWLGVAEKPRMVDILERVRVLVQQQLPQGIARSSVQQIFAHLAKRWADDLNEDPLLTQMQTMQWLPASGDTSSWHKPANLYTKFRKYIFETQAQFVDMAEQEKVSEFLRYLGVKSEPPPELVVKHLLQSASENNPVIDEVYNFLNHNAQHPAVGLLVGRACLHLKDHHRYVRPEHVFWGEHHFSPYRFRLSQEMRGYGALFDRLGVRETPDKTDAIKLLKEIGDKFGATNAPLDGEAKGIVLQCWKLLNESPDQSLRELQNHKVVPNGQDVLEFPSAVYFDDRPGYAEKLGLLNSVIPRPQDAWRAMQAAGVRPLSEAVRTTLVEREQPAPEENLRGLVVSRKGLIARVVEAHRGESGDDGWDLDLLDILRVESVSSLSVEYKVGYRRSPEPVPVTAYYNPGDGILYFRRQ